MANLIDSTQEAAASEFTKKLYDENKVVDRNLVNCFKSAFYAGVEWQRQKETSEKSEYYKYDKIKKYCWSTYDDHINGEYTYDTIEELIEDARELWLGGDELFEDQEDNDSAYIYVFETQIIDTNMISDKISQIVQEKYEGLILDYYGNYDDNDFLDLLHLGRDDEKKIADVIKHIFDKNLKGTYLTKNPQMYNITKTGYTLVCE